MKTITIGGVPEHFNLPWHLAIEGGKFKKNGIDLQWKEFPGGTGDMCRALREGSIDMAIILTSGIIKDIINGNPSKIVKIFVESPLLWGIHLSSNSKYTEVKELEHAKVAISRFGSGSQLMAIVNAHKHGFDHNNLKYEIVKNIDGGVEALTQGTADYFLWEHFTTKPLVDLGIFKRIESIKTPWPCFVIAARDDVLDNSKGDVKKIIKVINKQLKHFEDPLNDEQLIEIFSERYQQKIVDIKEWLVMTKWSRKKTISKKLINHIQNKLIKFNVIEQRVHPDQLIKKVF